MKNKCFDIGTIQAFIDGELSSDLSEKVIKHTALCDECALAMAETEESNALAFSALDDELNIIVPTERLRAKVFASINENEATEKVGLWQHLTESLSMSQGFSFRSPSLVAFASVVLFVSALAVGVNFYSGLPSVDGIEVAGGKGTVKVADLRPISETPKTDPQNIKVTEKDNTVNTDPTLVKRDTTKSNRLPIVKAKYDPNGKKKARVKRKSRTERKSGNGNLEPNYPLFEQSPEIVGEESYIQTIATLNKTIETNKDVVLKPKERIAFEKDLAVINFAIQRMKKEVRKNPKNKAAREVLKASYQNKIDLLNSVAEKNELIASLQ